MSNLSINEKNGVLLVDSRLLAEELGIQHRSFYQKLILKYREEIEEDWGFLRFQIAKIPEASQRGRPEKYVLLTEQQSYLVLTYSKNTSQARQCKRNLVKAFDEAKKLLEKVISNQTHEESPIPDIPSIPSAKEKLETIRMGMNLLEDLGGWDKRTQVLLKDQVRNILLTNKLQPSPTEIASHQPRLEYPVSDRAIDLGYQPKFKQLLQIGKKAKKLYVERHGTEPVKREQFVGGTTRMVNSYGFEDLDLLDEAIADVMDKE